MVNKEKQKIALRSSWKDQIRLVVQQALLLRYKRVLTQKENWKIIFHLAPELMLLGFVSLLLTVGQGPISRICVSKSIGNSWHPCDMEKESTSYGADEHRRKLFAFVDSGDIQRRVLAATGSDKCAAKARLIVYLQYKYPRILRNKQISMLSKLNLIISWIS